MTTSLYTSDSHLGHARIIEYTHRPFVDRAEMDGVLIQNLREAKATGARIIHAGDLSFNFLQQVKRYGPLWPQLETDRDIIVLGNHDRTGKPEQLKAYVDHFAYINGTEATWQTNFTIVVDALDGQEVTVLVSHKPQKDLLGTDINVHGHLHNAVLFPEEHHHEEDFWSFESPVHFNASVELHDYRPVTLQQIADAKRNDYEVARRQAAEWAARQPLSPAT